MRVAQSIELTESEIKTLTKLVSRASNTHALDEASQDRVDGGRGRTKQNHCRAFGN